MPDKKKKKKKDQSKPPIRQTSEQADMEFLRGFGGLGMSGVQKAFGTKPKKNGN